MNIPVLGATRFPSPLKRWVDESERVPATILRSVAAPPPDGLLFELAGAREQLFFHPPETRAGIVTCDGKQFRVHRGMGLVPQIFDGEILHDLVGNMAVGHTRYSTTGSSHLRNGQTINTRARLA